jgi:hypothetical protein
MPYTIGVLKGFMGRQDEERARQLEADARRREVEGKIYESLLQSQDPEVQRMAMSGLFESAMPGKKKRGLAGYLGEIEGGTIYPALQRYTEEMIPVPGRGGGPSPPRPGGAAMPASQTVTPGSPPIGVGPAPTMAGAPPPSPTASVSPEEVTDYMQAGLSPAGAERAAGGPPPEVAAGTREPPPAITPYAPVQMSPPPVPMRRRGTGVATAQDIRDQQHQDRMELARLQGIAEEQGLLDMRALAIQEGRLEDVPDINAWIAINQQRKGGGYQWKTYMDAAGNPQVYRVDPRTGEVIEQEGLSPMPTARNSVAMNDAARILGAQNGQGYQNMQDIPPGHPDNAKVAEIAVRLAGQRAYTTGYQGTVGRGAGGMNVPADFATSRESNVPLGTTPNQGVGQMVMTEAEQQQRRGAAKVKDILSTIRNQRLWVLPSVQETSGNMPGASVRLRRAGRDPLSQYTRERQMRGMAELDADLNLVVNSLADVFGQRGAQSVPDIAMAYEAVVDAKDKLFSGDTRESALARVNEALRLMDIVLEKLPPELRFAPPAVGATPPNPARSTARPAQPSRFRREDIVIEEVQPGAR